MVPCRLRSASGNKLMCTWQLWQKQYKSWKCGIQVVNVAVQSFVTSTCNAHMYLGVNKRCQKGYLFDSVCLLVGLSVSSSSCTQNVTEDFFVKFLEDVGLGTRNNSLDFGCYLIPDKFLVCSELRQRHKDTIAACLLMFTSNREMSPLTCVRCD